MHFTLSIWFLWSTQEGNKNKLLIWGYRWHCFICYLFAWTNQNEFSLLLTNNFCSQYELHYGILALALASVYKRFFASNVWPFSFLTADCVSLPFKNNRRLRCSRHFKKCCRSKSRTSWVSGHLSAHIIRQHSIADTKDKCYISGCWTVVWTIVATMIINL